MLNAGTIHGAAGKDRLSYIDFAKGIVAIAVIVGHLVPFNGRVFRLIFSFHMPFFFLLQGHMQKETLPPFRKFITGKVKRLLVPSWCFRFLSFILLDKCIIAGTFPSVQETLFVVFWKAAAEWYLPVAFCVSIGMYFYTLLFNKYGNNIFFPLFTAAFIAVFTQLRESCPYHDTKYLPFYPDSFLLAFSFALIGFWLNQMNVLKKCRIAYRELRNTIKQILLWICILALYVFMARNNTSGNYVNMADNSVGWNVLAYFASAVIPFVAIMLSGFCAEPSSHFAVRWIRLLGRHSLLIYLGHMIIHKLISFLVERASDGAMVLRPMFNLSIGWMAAYFLVSIIVLTTLCLLQEKIPFLHKK